MFRWIEYNIWTPYERFPNSSGGLGKPPNWAHLGVSQDGIVRAEPQKTVDDVKALG